MKKILYIINVDWFFISHFLPVGLEGIKRGYEVHIACGITDKKEYLESLGFMVHPLSISRSGIGVKTEIKTESKVIETTNIESKKNTKTTTRTKKNDNKDYEIEEP